MWSPFYRAITLIEHIRYGTVTADLLRKYKETGSFFAHVNAYIEEYTKRSPLYTEFKKLIDAINNDANDVRITFQQSQTLENIYKQYKIIIEKRCTKNQQVTTSYNNLLPLYNTVFSELRGIVGSA